MRYSSIALIALLACTQAFAVVAVPSEKSARSKNITVELRRGAPVPKWTQPLAEIPQTERTEAVVLRLNESQVLAGDQPAYLVNRAIQVNDRSALAAIGQVSLTYYSAYQALSLHRVAIMRDGKVLDRTASVDARLLQRETGIESGMYGGASTIQLLLDDVRVGDTLCLTYSVVGANPVFGKQWFGEYAWDQWAPVERRRLVVLYPKQRKIAWRQLGDHRSEPVVPRIDTSGPYEVLTFEGRNLDPLDDEPSIASDYLPARTLQFSEFPDWASVARWASGLFPQPPIDTTLKGLADQFRKHPTPEARAAAALQWVQDEIRYFSVSIGENSHKPQLPGTVLKRRYGDCKDKSYLLISLLSQLGIQARPVLLSANAPRIPAKVGPSPGWFDHVIVEMQIDGKNYYVDPTRTGQQVPLDKLSTAFPGAYGLVVDAATTALIALPERSGQGPDYEVVETISVKDYSGDATMEMREIFRAELAEVSRQRFAALSPLELKKAALKDYEKRYPGIVLLDAPVVTDGKLVNQLEVHARYRLPKAVNLVDGAQSIDYRARPLDGVMALPDKLVRSFPLEMPASQFHGRYRLNVHWPDDVRASDPPWSRFIDNRFFQAHETYSFRGNHLNHMVDYRAKARTVLAAEVPELHKEAKQLDELAQGRFTARLHNKIDKKTGGFSARDLDLVRMAAAADDLALAMEKLEDSAVPRDRACLLLRTASYADGLLESVGQKMFTRAQRIINDDSKDPAASVCRARLAFEGGDFATSAHLYRQLGDELASKHPKELRNMAWAHLYSGQLDQALTTNQQYLGLQAKAGIYVGAELDMVDSIALLQRGGHTPSADMLQRARNAPDGPWPQPLLAMQAGLFGQDELIMLVNSMPEHVRAHALTEAYFYIGQLRLASGDKIGAAAAFRRLQEDGIRSSHLYLQGAAELRLLSNAKNVLSTVEKAISAGNFELAFNYLTEGASNGDSMAQLGLGWAYQHGQGVVADLDKAVQWYRKAADDGNPKAYFVLSELYRLGQGVPKDEEKSLALLRTSAELGNAAAMNSLGWRYYQGHGYTVDPAYAALWFQRAAVRGVADAKYGLGLALYHGKGLPRDLRTAAALYLSAAKQGHASAQLDIGYMYETGEGVAKDAAEAVAWYRKSAEQGNAIAQHNLGLCYENGIGVAADEKSAVSWYRKAAEQGYVSAMTKYGYFLENSKSMKPDAVEAHVWYLKAAERDDPYAQYNLAQQYRLGRGVAADPALAFKWYMKAAKNGDVDAMTLLGTALRDGSGVAKDLNEALRWFTAAAEGGDGLGILRLGMMYFDGSGIGRDYGRAYKLFEQAGAKGETAGYYWLGRLHENGLGCAKDETKARALYVQAGNVGDAKIRLAVMSAHGRGGPREPAYFSRTLEDWSQDAEIEWMEKLAQAFEASFDGPRTQQVYLRLFQIVEKSGHPKRTRLALAALADSYANFGMPLKAEPYFLRLLALKENEFGPQHEEVANTLEDLASVYASTARLALAESMSRRALDMRMAGLGPGNRQKWRNQRNLAGYVGAQGDLVRAREYLVQVLSFAEKDLGSAHGEFPDELLWIGKQYFELGQYSDAESLFLRALSIVESKPDAGGQLESLLNELAWTLSARGAYAESERLFRRLAALREKHLGNEHPAYAAALGGLGLQLSKLDRHLEAEQALHKALVLREIFLGKIDGEVAIALNQAGLGWTRQGKFAEAEAALKKALALRESTLTPVHVDIAESLTGLGTLYLSQRKFDQAEPLLRRALAIRKQLMPAHPDTRSGEELVEELNRRGQRP